MGTFLIVAVASVPKKCGSHCGHDERRGGMLRSTGRGMHNVNTPDVMLGRSERQGWGCK
jgi:hypothetical protein